jgi:hypothetical protein
MQFHIYRIAQRKIELLDLTDCTTKDELPAEPDSSNYLTKADMFYEVSSG